MRGTNSNPFLTHWSGRMVLSRGFIPEVDIS
jgi:hypothetical protein